MCKVMEDMRNEAERDGARKAEQRTTVNHIKDIMDSFVFCLSSSPNDGSIDELKSEDISSFNAVRYDKILMATTRKIYFTPDAV